MSYVLSLKPPRATITQFGGMAKTSVLKWLFSSEKLVLVTPSACTRYYVAYSHLWGPRVEGRLKKKKKKEGKREKGKRREKEEKKRAAYAGTVEELGS